MQLCESIVTATPWDHCHILECARKITETFADISVDVFGYAFCSAPNATDETCGRTCLRKWGPWGMWMELKPHFFASKFCGQWWSFKVPLSATHSWCVRKSGSHLGLPTLSCQHMNTSRGKFDSFPSVLVFPREDSIAGLISVEVQSPAINFWRGWIEFLCMWNVSEPCIYTVQWLLWWDHINQHIKTQYNIKSLSQLAEVSFSIFSKQLN